MHGCSHALTVSVHVMPMFVVVPGSETGSDAGSGSGMATGSSHRKLARGSTFNAASGLGVGSGAGAGAGAGATGSAGGGSGGASAAASSVAPSVVSGEDGRPMVGAVDDDMGDGEDGGEAIVTAMAALELATVMGEAGMEDLAGLRGKEFMMDPRCVGVCVWCWWVGGWVGVHMGAMHVWCCLCSHLRSCVATGCSTPAASTKPACPAVGCCPAPVAWPPWPRGCRITSMSGAAPQTTAATASGTASSPSAKLTAGYAPLPPSPHTHAHARQHRPRASVLPVLTCDITSRLVRGSCVSRCVAQVRHTGFGHSALGGTLVFTDPAMALSVAITVNELTSDRQVVRDLVRFVCRELDVGTPLDV